MKINYLIEKITKLSENIIVNEKNNPLTNIGTVLNNAVHAIAPKVGRIIAFSSQMPVNGFGKLKRRCDTKVMGKSNRLYA